MLRIVGGTLRGRVLGAPEGRSTRPTSARVREAIFNVIAHHPTHGVDLEAARVADLFAGSGALGIEALSRGAREAVFVERDRRAASLLRHNLKVLGLEQRSEVLTLDVSRVRTALETRAPFDLWLLDPPYEPRGETLEMLGLLAPATLMACPGVLVLEQATGAGTPLLSGFAPPIARRWGGTEALFFPRNMGVQPGNGDDLE